MSTTYIHYLALFVWNQEEIAPRILAGQDNISWSQYTRIRGAGQPRGLRWKSFNFKSPAWSLVGAGDFSNVTVQGLQQVCVANIHYSAWEKSDKFQIKSLFYLSYFLCNNIMVCIVYTQCCIQCCTLGLPPYHGTALYSKQTNMRSHVSCDWHGSSPGHPSFSHPLQLSGLYCSASVWSGEFSLSGLSSPSVSCILIVTGGQGQVQRQDETGPDLLSNYPNNNALVSSDPAYPPIYPSRQLLHAFLSPHVTETLEKYQHYFLCFLIKVKLCKSTILCSALISTFHGRREFWNIMNNSNFLN